MIKNLRIVAILFLITNLFIPYFVLAQNTNIDKFQYLSPVPNSKLNSVETNIIIRFGDVFDNYNLNNIITVIGSRSGRHSGKTTLAEKNKTLLFLPDKKFSDGEIVTVELNRNLKTILGKQIPYLQYTFETSKIDLNAKLKSNPQKYLKLFFPDLYSKKNISNLENTDTQKGITRKSYTIQKDSLPEDFPIATIDTFNNPTPGYIFYAPFSFPSFLPNYLIIADNYGIPIFYRKIPIGNNFDFKKQTTGVLTYFNTEYNQFYVMDSSYNLIDTLQMKNGQTADIHELIITKNNHALMMDYDLQPIAMDTVIQGGNPNANVLGLVIQELDENKNVVFQWRSWDHFKITDATYDVNLTNATIDYVHGNAIEVDNDGNILISSRNLDEITKISRETGDIIWRMGGEYCKNNQFTFINDPVGFSHQHDIRRLPNGNITLFDNGNLHSPKYSRAVEYQIDEVNKLVFLVWEYCNEPKTYSDAMGDARRLYNHNTFIGWGTGTEPAMSEVSADGSIKFYLAFPDTVFNYRAFKFPWKTNLFVANPDSLLFGYISVGDSLVKPLIVTNNSDQEIEINEILNRDSAFSVITSIPIIIPSYDYATIQVKFKPKLVGNLFDDLYLQWNKPNERIAQVVPLFGTTDSTAVSVKNNNYFLDFSLSQNYPNPFNPITIINYTIPKQSYVNIRVYDILGKEVATLVNEVKGTGTYKVKFDGSSLTSGIYLYRLEAGRFSKTRKLILLK